MKQQQAQADAYMSPGKPSRNERESASRELSTKKKETESKSELSSARKGGASKEGLALVMSIMRAPKAFEEKLAIGALAFVKAVLVQDEVSVRV